jgi:hypothetical protein
MIHFRPPRLSNNAPRYEEVRRATLNFEVLGGEPVSRHDEDLSPMGQIYYLRESREQSSDYQSKGRPDDQRRSAN